MSDDARSPMVALSINLMGDAISFAEAGTVVTVAKN